MWTPFLQDYTICSGGSGGEERRNSLFNTAPVLLRDRNASCLQRRVLEPAHVWCGDGNWWALIG